MRRAPGDVVATMMKELDVDVAVVWLLDTDEVVPVLPVVEVMVPVEVDTADELVGVVLLRDVVE